MVHAANGLCKHIADLKDLKLGAVTQVLLLWNAVGDHDFVQRARVDSLHRVAGEDAVCDECVHYSRALFLEEFGCTSDGVGGVGKVIDQDRAAIGDVSD